MANSIKTLVSLLGVNGINAKAVENNLFDHIIFDVSYDTDANLSFSELVDFYKINRYENLPLGLQFAYELFGQFRNPKNAVNTILNHIENIKEFKAESFEKQAQFTPMQVEKDEIKDIRDFKGLLNLIEAKKDVYDIDTLNALAIKWSELNGYTGTAGTMFSDFYITNDNDNLKKGTLVKVYDALFAKEIYAKVVQASPNGFLTLFADDMDLLITSETAKTIEIVEDFNLNEVTEEYKTTFNQAYEEYIEDLSISREEKLEKAIKRLEKVNNELEKKSKAKEKVISSKALAREILSTKPTTLEELAEARKLLNTNSDKLVKTHKDALRRIFAYNTNKAKAEAKAIKEALQAESKAKKEAEKAKKEAEKVAKVAVTDAIPTEQTEKPNRPKNGRGNKTK